MAAIDSKECPKGSKWQVEGLGWVVEGVGPWKKGWTIEGVVLQKLQKQGFLDTKSGKRPTYKCQTEQPGMQACLSRGRRCQEKKTVAEKVGNTPSCAGAWVVRLKLDGVRVRSSTGDSSSGG